jgi:uncharacterized protein (TIGR02996 family)
VEAALSNASDDMSDETALLRAIAAHPDEDTPRLAFADYVEERGNPDRAAFIRGQIELARLKKDSLKRREIAFRCRQLLDAHEEEWLSPRSVFRWDWAWARGFVETYTTTPGDMEAGDAGLFETHPFRRVWVREAEDDIGGVSIIPTGNHVTALDLTGNNLNVNKLKKLAKMTHLPHLRELGLMFNALRDTAVKVLCGEPFFQRLELIRLGANPFTDTGRDQLRAHFGARVTFEHDRDPDRLYTIRDDYLRVGWGRDFAQFLMIAGEELQQVAVFDHAGNLLSTDERTVEHGKGQNAQTRAANREDARDNWLAELHYKSATIKVKAFGFPNGAGLTPFNWWADVFDGREPALGERRDSVDYWLEQGKFRFALGGWRDVWLNRAGEVTDT